MASRRRFGGFSAGSGDYTSGGDIELLLRIFFPKFYEKLQREGMGRAQEMARFEKGEALGAEKEMSDLEIKQKKQESENEAALKERTQRDEDFRVGGLLTKEGTRQRSEQLKRTPGFGIGGLSLTPSQATGGVSEDFANYPGASWGVEDTGLASRMAQQISSGEQVRNQLPFYAAEANRREQLGQSNTGLQLEQNLLTKQNLGINEELSQLAKQATIDEKYRDPNFVFAPGNVPRLGLSQGGLRQSTTQGGAKYNLKTKKYDIEPTKQTIENIPPSVRPVGPVGRINLNGAIGNPGSDNTGGESPGMDDTTPDPLTGQNANPQAETGQHEQVAPRNSVGQLLSKGLNQTLTGGLARGSIGEFGNQLLTKGANTLTDTLYGAAGGVDNVLKYLKPKTKRVLDIIKQEAGMY